jgi:hypothetical protein
MGALTVPCGRLVIKGYLRGLQQPEKREAGVGFKNRPAAAPRHCDLLLHVCKQSCKVGSSRRR